MQIRVEKLRTNINLLHPVMPKNPSLKVLNNVILKDGFMRASNLETEVSIAIPEISGDAFLLPFRQVMELLKYVPGDLIMTIEYNNKSVKLTWDGGKAIFLVPDYKEFPDTSLRAPQTGAVLNGDVLTGAMMDALKYAATNDARPVLSGVALIMDGTIQVAAADGFRLSYEATKLSWPFKQTIVVPASTVSVLHHLWHKAPAKPALANSLIAQLTAARPLRIGLWEGAMSAEFGNITVVSRLIPGAYPDSLALLNGMKEPIKVKFFGPDLLNAANRLAKIAGAGNDIVKLQWTDTKMTVSASHAETGESQAEIPVMEGSQPGRTALNLRYIVEALSGKDGLVTLGNESKSSPVLFHYGKHPIIAVMPMFVEWDEDPAKKSETKEEPAAEDIHEDVQTEESAAEESAEELEETEETGQEPVTEEEMETPSDEKELEPVATVLETKKNGGRKKKRKTE